MYVVVVGVVHWPLNVEDDGSVEEQGWKGWTVYRCFPREVSVVHSYSFSSWLSLHTSTLQCLQLLSGTQRSRQ